MALGRGLNSLIPPRDSAANIYNQAKASALADGAQATVQEVSVTAITQNPHQPRQHFAHTALEELIQSIKQYGILQPLLVSPLADDQYELIAGERRLRAARVAGLKTVPVIIRQAEELEKLELALIENIQRSDLNPIEKAASYHKLIQEFGLNHEEAAKKMGISRSALSNTLRLLELAGDIQKALADGKITEGHAKVLLGLPSAAEQRRYVERVIQEQWSVHTLSTQVAGQTKQRHSKQSATALPAHVSAWQEELQSALGTKVNITSKKIEIDYYSLEELSNLVKKIMR